MNVEQLFLATLNNLEALAAAGDEYSILCASGLLRKLLLNGNPLVHQVNRKYKLKITFPLCGRRSTRMMLALNPEFYSALGAIHTSGSKVHQKEDVKLPDFLSSPVLKYGSQIATIGDLINHSANVLGGVHRGDPINDKQVALSSAGENIIAWELPINIAQLKPIVLVVLDGLVSLRQLVEEQIV